MEPESEVLAVYRRVYSSDLGEGMDAVRRRPDEQPLLTFSHTSGLELALVGGVLVLAGPDEVLAGFRDTALTTIVLDLNRALARAGAKGATIVRPPASQPTGRNATVRFPSGPQIEYVEWNEVTRRRVLGP